MPLLREVMIRLRGRRGRGSLSREGAPNRDWGRSRCAGAEDTRLQIGELRLDWLNINYEVKTKNKSDVTPDHIWGGSLGVMKSRF